MAGKVKGKILEDETGIPSRNHGPTRVEGQVKKETKDMTLVTKPGCRLFTPQALADLEPWGRHKQNRKAGELPTGTGAAGAQPV